MKKNPQILLSSLLACLSLALLGPSVGAAATTSETFEAVFEPYEKIRHALLHDSIEGVDESAAAIVERAQQAAEAEGHPEKVAELLPQIATAAGKMSEGHGIDGVREAFYELSKLLVQYRWEVEGEELPIVAYCPMAKKSWLQPAGEIGNPYHGQSMPTCGRVVEE